jgi:drug/metabolite transporter (DMT)-like permease
MTIRLSRFLLNLSDATLVGGVSQYWTTLALYYAPPAVVSPFNYTALIWGSGLGLFVWADLPTCQRSSARQSRP